MTERWGSRARVALQMPGRARLAQLEAELAEEIRVLQLIVHLRHFTPSAQSPPLRAPVLRIPVQRTAPTGVPAKPRGRLQRGHL